MLPIATPYRYAAVALACFVAGWVAQGWRASAAASEVKAEAAKAVATSASQALDQFIERANQMADAASQAQAGATAIASTAAKIRKDVANVKAPLPADCRPDAERLRNRNAAIEAYNRAATGQLPRGTVQND